MVEKITNLMANNIKLIFEDNLKNIEEMLIRVKLMS